jgi:drug/metabolite transporter (DMT)-like permease
MLAHAFARMEAARLAPVGYVTLVWGVLFGFLFFAEVPGLATLGGAALIALGTLLTRRRGSHAVSGAQHENPKLQGLSRWFSRANSRLV